MTRKLIPAALLLCLLLSTFAAEPPQIVWASDPVRPDEVVLVQGEGFTAGCTVELSRLGDQTWETIRPLQSSPQSLKFVVPKNWPMGIWACRVRSGDAVSETVVLNAPDPWWWNGDAGSTATPKARELVLRPDEHIGPFAIPVVRADKSPGRHAADAFHAI